MTHKTKFISFGVILLVAGLTGNHFRYDLVEVISVPITKEGGFNSYQIWTWIVELVSVCANLCGAASILYGFISKGKDKKMSRSREGRHTAKASTWLLRHKLVGTRDEAVKLIKRKKVFIRDKLAQTGIGYYRVKKHEIEIRN